MTNFDVENEWLSMERRLVMIANQVSLDIALLLLRNFFDGTPEVLRALSEALDLEDLETVRRLGHKLKSSTGNIGAKGLLELCSDLESCEALAQATSGVRMLQNSFEGLRQHYLKTPPFLTPGMGRSTPSPTT